LNTHNPSGIKRPSSETVNSKQRLISKVLSPAVKLWLRSQVQQVSDLEVKIWGSDRQILSGHIERVSISARHAVYQGLHLTQIQLITEGIRVNLAAILRGQPLRLLEPVPVFVELLLQELDLNTSLQSPLLINALTELLLKLFPATCPVGSKLTWHKIGIDNGQLILNATLTGLHNNPTPVIIRTGLSLASSHELQLEYPQLQTLDLPAEKKDSFQMDLGSEVAIGELTLIPGQLVCSGRINVIP